MLSFTLCSQVLPSNNERRYQVTRVKIAEDHGFLYQVGRYRYRRWNVFPSSCCYFGILEIFIFHTDLFKVKRCHVVKERLGVCIRDTKRVKFVKQCFTELLHNFGEKTLNWFVACFQMRIQFPVLLSN